MKIQYLIILFLMIFLGKWEDGFCRAPTKEEIIAAATLGETIKWPDKLTGKQVEMARQIDWKTGKKLDGCV